MRSKLFIPGTRPELFAKALAGAADALSVDLEDSVTPGSKPQARAAARDFLGTLSAREHGKTIIVRVNGIATGEFAADLDAVVRDGLDIINLPKVESPEEIHAAIAEIAAHEQARRLQTPIGLLVNIESPKGLRQAVQIAGAHRRVMGLQLGFADLLEPLGIARDNLVAVQQIQLAVRLAAGEAGIAVFDSAYADFSDPDGFEREALVAKSLGFSGKSCIHPNQVGLANRIFSPTPEQVAYARRVCDAALGAQRNGQGVVGVDGRMVDAPFVRQAEHLLRLARQLGLASD